MKSDQSFDSFMRIKKMDIKKSNDGVKVSFKHNLIRILDQSQNNSRDSLLEDWSNIR